MLKFGCAPLTIGLATTALAADPFPPPIGVQVGDMNRKAEACADFFECTNGDWRAQNAADFRCLLQPAPQ